MYRKYWQPDHHLADMLGFVHVYKLHMEAKICRRLQKDEIVHHMDYDKSNDDPANLRLLIRQQHNSLPEQQVRFLISKGLLQEFWDWWDAHHNDPPDPERELRYELNRLLNEQEMTKRKLYKLESNNAEEKTNDNEQLV
jgi:hypothetical protein